MYIILSRIKAVWKVLINAFVNQCRKTLIQSGHAIKKICRFLIGLIIVLLGITVVCLIGYLPFIIWHEYPIIPSELPSARDTISVFLIGALIICCLGLIGILVIVGGGLLGIGIYKLGCFVTGFKEKGRER